MESDSDVLPEVGYNFIIKVVRIAFECAFYGKGHLIRDFSSLINVRYPTAGVYLLLISTSTVILW